MRDRNVPRKAKRNDTGIETIPGLVNGKYAKSSDGKIDEGEPETVGDRTTRVKQEIRPL